MSDLKTEKDFRKYFTLENYFTPNEMEYRRSMVQDAGLDFPSIIRGVEKYREKTRKELLDTNGERFYFCFTKELHRRTEAINSFWRTIEYRLQGRYAKKLIFDTLVSEAFSSSTIEGAYSTKKRTEELIKKNLSPEDKSEMMIVNNYEGLEYIGKRRRDPLTPEIILELHKIVSDGTLDEPEDEGRFRDGPVDIRDAKQKVIFAPTGNLTKMHSMIEDLISFINDDDDMGEVVDCIHKAIFFHFMYGFIHPHFDGNGRTLRVLFTHLLNVCGYDMFRFISLSEVIMENKKDYEKAYLAVERNLNGNGAYDVTYFIYYITNVMIKGLDRLADRINKYTIEAIMLETIEERGLVLTQTQGRLVRSIARSEVQVDTRTLAKRLKLTEYTIRKHVNYLVDAGVVKKTKVGRKLYFSPRLD